MCRRPERRADGGGARIVLPPLVASLSLSFSFTLHPRPSQPSNINHHRHRARDTHLLARSARFYHRLPPLPVTLLGTDGRAYRSRRLAASTLPWSGVVIYEYAILPQQKGCLPGRGSSLPHRGSLDLHDYVARHAEKCPRARRQTRRQGRGGREEPSIAMYSECVGGAWWSGSILDPDNP